MNSDGTEKKTLSAFLAAQRASVLAIVDGLRRPVPPFRCRDRPHAVVGTPTGSTPEPMGDELADLRGIIMHVIEETARHAGHLDIARELLDGRTGLGPR
ncbi:DUF664 domain-containing protein [Streptomyces sp. NPDC102340]|uniref:mycothiol transferase n=1 Tax=unclassified Streptomyces TaxID=2593676 RepID=UPI003824D420